MNLVSRCSSVDEFVAAFRTYVHRDHVFVPTTGQLPTGRRARIAITLADGTPVIAGDAEVLSSSAVPQGPYQKPGVRLRFVEIDDAARAVMTRLEQARSEPGQMLADAVGGTTGARADIRNVEAGGRDATEAALCTIVEVGAPAVTAAGGAVPRVELPGMSRGSSPKIPAPGGLGGVPGKSFKIPSIPAIPSPSASSPSLSRPSPADSGSAVPIAPERTAPASGDYTVPTEPSFREPSLPVASAPPAPASTASPAPAMSPAPAGGKARNRTMLGRVPGKTPGTESGPTAVARTDSAPHATPPVDDGATTRMPPLAMMPEVPPLPESSQTTRMEPLFPEAKHTPTRTPTPAPGATPGAASPPTPAPTPGDVASASLNPPGRNFARTLLGLPAIDLPPKPSGQMPAVTPPAATPPATPPAPARPSMPLSADDGWGAPEDGYVGEATERAETPPPIAAEPDAGVDVDVDLAPEEPALELPPQPPGATVMPPTAPGTPVAPLGKGLRAGPAAPTLRTPQSMLELGHQARGPSKPLPGMPPARPPSIPGEPIAAAQAPTIITRAPPPLPAAAQAPTIITGAPAASPVAGLGPPRPARDASETELVMRRDLEGTDALLAARSRRPLIIGVVAALVVFSGIVIGVMLGSGDKKKPSKPSAPVAAPVQPADAAPAQPTAAQAVDAAAERVATAPATADAAVETAPPEPEEVATQPEPDEPEPDEPEPAAPPEPAVAAKKPGAGECAVAFTSTPSGASVSIGGKKKGSTPLTLNLPCKKSTAVFERLRYGDTKKAFTPKKGKTTKVAVRLDRPKFSVKVTSTPSGATVTVNGRNAGKTPATVKVTGFQATTIKVSKPGFQTKTTKVTAKKNGTVVKVPLRRGN